VPWLGASGCVALMPFVPRGSLLTAAAVVALGSALVLLRSRRRRR